MAQVGAGPSSGTRLGAPANTSFVEWGAVFAGAVTAAALSFVLLTFGAAIGLSAASPWPNSGASAKMIGALAIFWAMAQQIGAAMAGGYVAGRMRARWADATEDEVEFRDGLHGGLVWAVGVVIGAALLLSTAGSIAKTGSELAGRAVAAASTNADPLAYQMDVLLRPSTGTAAPRAAGPAAASPTATSADLRLEMARVFAKSIANGSLTEPDRSYLAAVVAQRTGLPQPEAEKRVNDAFAEANRAAREAADKARRAAVLTGFVTAASLIIALAAAWWAAQRGGHHRDNAIPARFVTPPRRRTVS